MYNRIKNTSYEMFLIMIVFKRRLILRIDYSLKALNLCFKARKIVLLDSY